MQVSGDLYVPCFESGIWNIRISMEFFNSQFHMFCSSKLFIAQLVNLNPFLLKNKGWYSSTRAWQKIQICEWYFILQNYQNYVFQRFLHSKYGAFFMKCTFVILYNFQNKSFQAFLILSMDPFKAPLCGIAVVLFMSMWCVISIFLVVPISFFLFSSYNLLWWHLLMLWFFATLLSGHLKISIRVDLDCKYWEVLNSYEDIFDQYGYVSHLSILNYTSARYSGNLEIHRPKKRVLPDTM